MSDSEYPKWVQRAAHVGHVLVTSALEEAALLASWRLVQGVDLTPEERQDIAKQKAIDAKAIAEAAAKAAQKAAEDAQAELEAAEAALAEAQAEGVADKPALRAKR